MSLTTMGVGMHIRFEIIHRKSTLSTLSLELPSKEAIMKLNSINGVLLSVMIVFSIGISHIE